MVSTSFCCRAKNAGSLFFRSLQPRGSCYAHCTTLAPCQKSDAGLLFPQKPKDLESDLWLRMVSHPEVGRVSGWPQRPTAPAGHTMRIVPCWRYLLLRILRRVFEAARDCLAWRCLPMNKFILTVFVDCKWRSSIIASHQILRQGLFG